MTQSEERTDFIVNALAEIRFEPERLQSGDFLAAKADFLLDQYTALGDSPTHDRTQFADIPLTAFNEQGVRYNVTNSLIFDNYVIKIGPCVLNVEQHQPYEGWEEFLPKILSALSLVNGLVSITSYSRVSLRYQNILDVSDDNEGGLGLRLQLQLGSKTLQDIHNVFVKVNLEDGKYLNIIQVAPHAEATNKLTGGKWEGALLDIDTIYQGEDVSEETMSHILNEAHQSLKACFYDFITDQAKERLSSNYGEKNA